MTGASPLPKVEEMKMFRSLNLKSLLWLMMTVMLMKTPDLMF